MTRTPVSTYRLQVTEEFDLFEVARRLPYLHELGADWVYLSPLLHAEAGSNHGYDVVAHDRIDPARGGAEGLAAVSAEARRLGMGVLVDIVPNHVGVATPPDNRWWWDLLQLGRESAHAAAFDVDWEAGDEPDPDPRRRRRRLGPRHRPDRSLDARRRRAPLPRPPVPARARIADDGADSNTVHDASTTSSCTGRSPTTSSTTGASSPSTPSPRSASRTRRCSPTRTSRSAAGSTRASSTGCGSTTPTACATPRGYLDDLAAITGGAYVLVEKILEPGERLSSVLGHRRHHRVRRARAWSTGCSPTRRASRPLDALETRLRGEPVDWPELIHGTKRAVADGILRSEVNRITRELRRRGSRPARRDVESLSAETVADAVAELLACFPVYRSYLPEGRKHLDHAFARARAHRPDLADGLDVIAPVLGDPASAPALRFQQTSGMVMAKGVEDCAFYRYSRLTSLNEVGGDPSEFVAPSRRLPHPDDRAGRPSARTR